MDIILLILLFVYIVQTIDITARKIVDKEHRPYWLVVFPALLILSLLFGLPRFTLFIVLFFLTFWSSVCRSSGYGFNYHFILMIAAGVVFGPVAGAIIGVVPLLMVPLIRPDAQVIAVYFSAILLGIVGAVSGFLGGVLPSDLISLTITLLVVYNAVRAFFLFGKASVKDVYVFTLVNILLNYYLITKFLVPLIEYLAT